ncbi:methyl-accepting chemotaxis protein [Reinekea sp. G2M2-21]|uniref:methyl-accepting chemotaxis protein n=1 Tax=Reinekea sp. G2M2-21 TaxID=2788942 RepID=UPI0018AC3333|nr:methyl-accepting chemotaxis protein [Reinekea sp. G2M2-21]
MFHFKKLFQKLLVAFLSLSILPMIILVWITLNKASDALEIQSLNQLEAVREIKHKQIDDFIENTLTTLNVIKEDPATVQAMSKINKAFKTAGNSIKDGQWELLESIYQPRFTSIVDRTHWYDLFLVNTDGYVVFSAARESDLGQSLTSETLKNTSFYKVFEKAQTAPDDVVSIADFLPYTPSNNEPAAFMMTPLVDALTRKRMGYLAMQLPLTEINAIMHRRDGMGESGETYLVGPDNRMRSDSFLDPKARSVAASFTGSVSDNGVATEATRQVFSGNSGIAHISNPVGTAVLSAFTPIEIGDFTWALIAEMDEAEAFAAITTLWQIAIGLFAVTIVIVVLIGMVIARSISLPIMAVSQSASDIADGDLTVDVAITQHDEVGTLQKSMKSMVSKLHTMVNHIATSADQQASAAEELAAITEQTTATVNRQQLATDQVASAITEMSASIAEVTQNTVEASNAAKTTSDQMDSSATVVRDTVTEVQELERQIKNAVDLIQQLEKGASDIGGILDVIKGIADQTNLLALNAAIEAARAGDQGRGFAVVADEVRSLAQSTQNSAGEIEQMITKLQAGAHSSVSAMTNGAKQTDIIVSKIKNLADVLNQSQVAVNQISDMSLQIATATEEQSSVSNEISDRANEISQLSTETGESATQIATASDELARLAGDLASQVSQFKI